MITDPVLNRAAEALHAKVIRLDDFGDIENVTELFSGAELEAILGVVRDAIAAPVLALHRPLGGTSTCRECYGTVPCPTASALGVSA